MKLLTLIVAMVLSGCDGLDYDPSKHTVSENMEFFCKLDSRISGCDKFLRPIEEPTK